jgi:hypothetical protein
LFPVGKLAEDGLAGDNGATLGFLATGEDPLLVVSMFASFIRMKKVC